MGVVGIVVNPVSGTDIRRATSTAGFMDNMQKARIVKSLLKGLEAVEVEKVLFMRDFYGIAAHALWDMKELKIDAEILDMKPTGSYIDTVNAVAEMVEQGVAVIILLGGDGTVRVASKASGQTPLLPISTGTNNVIPYFIDGTVAGLAAGAVAEGLVDSSEVSFRAKRIAVLLNGIQAEHALIDAASVMYPFVGSRAITEPSLVREAVVVLAPPTSIGIASIAAMMKPLHHSDGEALYFRLGERGRAVKAITSPGVVEKVLIEEVREVPIGSKIVLEGAKGAITIELDGERELQVPKGSEITLVPLADGPIILDVHKIMGTISSEGIFTDYRAF